MKTEHIKYFLEVVRQGSINKASQTLHLNHQHLGKIITSIEDEVGGKLLVRNRVGILCNDVGERAVELMQQMDGLYDELLKLYSDTRAITNLRKVHCFVFARTNHINQSDSILKLKRKFPELSVEFRETSHEETIDAVAHNKDFIGNILYFDIPELRFSLPEECFTYAAMDVEPVVIMSRNNPLKSKYKDISLKTLCQYPIALYCPYEISKHHFAQLLSHYRCIDIQYVISNLQSYEDILLHSNTISLGLKPKNSFDGKLLLSDDYVCIPIREKISARSIWIINREAVNDSVICNYLNSILSYRF